MSDGTLDPRGVRFTASITSVILALGLVTMSWRVMAAQTVLFAMCAFIGMNLNPWGHLYRGAVQPRLRTLDRSQREDPAPVRFSQGVGFVFALVATAGYAAGFGTVGLTANALALAAALLNALFGFCLGCHLYLTMRRFLPATSTARTQ